MNLILNVIWKNKWIITGILYNQPNIEEEKQWEGIAISDNKTFFKAMPIKTVWYSDRDW